MSTTTSKSYFGKSILLIFLAIAAFLGFKQALPDRLFSSEPTASNNANIVIDSLMLEAMADSTAVVNTPPKAVATDSITSAEENDANFNPALTADGYNNLKRFYAKLQALEQDKSKKVRIAYFGDSMNDGDFIVQDVRSEFQDKYGGQGVGYVAISSLSAGARGSISHQYSKNWKTQSFVKVKKPISPFGVDGQVFFANGGGQWVKYRAQSQKHSTELFNPTLLYGRSGNHNASVTIKTDSTYSKALTPSRLLNTLHLSGNVKSLQVNFNSADSIPVYGFNFDDGKGIHVDNFSIRGNSGLPLSILNPSLMNAFDNTLQYDLIVLQYGANVLGYGTTNYRWYEKNMTTVVNNLKECFPNADILVISTADKATKIDGVMQTDPAVVPLANSQKNYALKTGSGYISLYSVMGGNGSMVKWVNEGSAGKDYTHFTAKGSRKIGKLLFNEIEKGYAKYKQEHASE